MSASPLPRRWAARKLLQQRGRGRLNVRERIAGLCDAGSFNEYGALAGGSHPASGASWPVTAW
ncbi:MAG: hypothetical protein R3E50_00750 [Halioglobus sp.]